MSRSSRTHYEVLGLHPTAGDNDIDKAYITYASVWHPSKCNDANAPFVYSRISTAFHVLRTPSLRAAYDIGLLQARPEHLPPVPTGDAASAKSRRRPSNEEKERPLKQRSPSPHPVKARVDHLPDRAPPVPPKDAPSSSRSGNSHHNNHGHQLHPRPTSRPLSRSPSPRHGEIINNNNGAQQPPRAYIKVIVTSTPSGDGIERARIERHEPGLPVEVTEIVPDDAFLKWLAQQTSQPPQQEAAITVPHVAPKEKVRRQHRSHSSNHSSHSGHSGHGGHSSGHREHKHREYREPREHREHRERREHSRHRERAPSRRSSPSKRVAFLEPEHVSAAQLAPVR